MTSFEQYEKRLKELLPLKRYKHTEGVAYTAANLAMAYDYDMTKAYLAGLLHDNAKGFSHEKQIELCDMYGVNLSDVERINPVLVHAKLGSFLAEKDFGVKDTEILNAIRFHTTGKPDMGLLEKIIFLADYIEPNRKPIPYLDKIRQLAYKDLNKAILLEMEGTIQYNKEKGAVFDPLTLQTYEYYKNI